MKASAFERDKYRPSKHGKLLSVIPLPALSTTRAQIAHDHFSMQVHRRAERDPGREGVKALWNKWSLEKQTSQAQDPRSGHSFLRKPHKTSLVPREIKEKLPRAKPLGKYPGWKC